MRRISRTVCIFQIVLIHFRSCFHIFIDTPLSLVFAPLHTSKRDDIIREILPNFLFRVTWTFNPLCSHRDVILVGPKQKFTRRWDVVRPDFLSRRRRKCSTRRNDGDKRCRNLSVENFEKLVTYRPAFRR